MSQDVFNFSSKFDKISNYISSFSFNSPLTKDVSKSNFPGIEKIHPAKKIKSSSLAALPIPHKKHGIQHDNAAFVSRVASFELGKWNVYNLSPLYCAQYGWHLFSKDLLRCVTCRAFVCIKLPPLSQYDAYKNFVTVLKERLKSGHKLWCRWQHSPSPYSFCAPPLFFTISLFKTFAKSADTMLKVEDSLPLLNVQSLLQKLEIAESDLLVLFGSTNNTLTEHQLIAALMVICGWVCQKTPNTVRCNLCLRNVGLWNFYSVNNKEEYESSKERRRKRVTRPRLISGDSKELRVSSPTSSVETEIYEDLNVNRKESLSGQNRDNRKEVDVKRIRYSSSCSNEESNDTVIYDSDEATDKNTNLDGQNDRVDDGKENQSKSDSDVVSELDRKESKIEIKEECESNNMKKADSNDDDSLWSEALGEKTDVVSAESSNDSVDYEDSPSTASDKDESDGKKRKRQDSGDKMIEDSSIRESVDTKNMEKENDCLDNAKDINAVVDVGRKRLRDSDDEMEPPSKRVGVEASGDSDDDVEDSRSLFEPLDQHRPWCGWVTSHTKKNLADLYVENVKKDILGYLILPRRLKGLSPLDNADDLVSSSKYLVNIEGVRNIRSILSDWSLGFEEEISGMKNISSMQDDSVCEALD